MREAVPTPTLIGVVIETPDLHVEYLQCEDPLTWTRYRKDAQVFGDPVEAQRLAGELRAPNFFVYTVPAQTPTEVAKKTPARHRRRNVLPDLPPRHDWREDVPNAGVL